MKTTRLFFALLLMLASLSSYAQQTGIFNAVIPFNTENRVLSCYVPPDYDSTEQYGLLICLHGAGDNSNNYRTWLINALGWQNLFTNMIIVCPDGGEDLNRTFDWPETDPEIIAATIQYTKQNYNLDSNNIILQGFSLGGRSALKYGLEHASTFKGLLLNSPAIQDILDLENDTAISLGYDYDKAPILPTYIISGEMDNIFGNAGTRLASVLRKHNGIVELNVVPNMDHNLPGNTVTTKAKAFIDNPYTNYDLDVFEISTFPRQCSDFQPKCLVRNKGNIGVTSIAFNLQYGNLNSSYTWTGSLEAYEHKEITFPVMAAPNGTEELKITIGTVNTSQADPNMSDDSLSKRVEVVRNTDTELLLEGFDGDFDSWIFEDRGSLLGWYKDTGTNHGGSGSLGNSNSIFALYSLGVQTAVNSPVFNISGQVNPTLRFDVAFNYLKYLPPVFPSETIFADTLEIYITTDCGNTFQRIYKKGGAQLATAEEPIVNGLSFQETMFDPAQDEWRQEIIDLKPFANSNNAYLKFNCISGRGGSLYIDNLRVGDGMPVSVNEPQDETAFTMYPNPASDVVTIALDHPQKAKITIYDSLGRIVLDEYEVTPQNKQLTINTGDLGIGFHFIVINNGSHKTVKKLLVNP